MQLFSPQVQSPWRTQALMVLDGCHLSITVLLSTLGTQGAQESCHQHGSVWTSLEHGLRTGRGGRSTDTRVREGGPEPTCWGRPGTDVGVSRDGRRGSPGEAGQRAQKMGTQRRRARVAPSHQSSRHPILFQKSNVRSVHGHRLARRCVHPCAGPQQPVVGKAAPCPPQGRAETLPAPEQSRDAVPPRAEQRRCPPPPRAEQRCCLPLQRSVCSSPTCLGPWLFGFRFPCVEVGPQGTLGPHSRIPGWFLCTWGREPWSRAVEAPPGPRPWPESLPHCPSGRLGRRAPRAFRVVQGGRGGLPAGLGQLTPSLWRQLLPEVRQVCPATSLLSDTWKLGELRVKEKTGPAARLVPGLPGAGCLLRLHVAQVSTLCWCLPGANLLRETTGCVLPEAPAVPASPC